MPMSKSPDVVTANTSSRKRSYAQITRSSESQSTSPPPSKRRRTSLLPYPHSSSHIRSSRSNTPALRFVGDGLDFRRPAGSVMPSAQEEDLIDLTVDDDTPPPAPSTFANLAPRTTRSRSSEHSRNGQASSVARAPPFNQPLPNSHGFEVIDLDSDEDEVQDYAARNDGRQQNNAPHSPDVEFVRERQLPPPPVLNAPPDIRRRLPTPPAGATRFMNGMNGPLADIFRSAAQNVFGRNPGRRGFFGDLMQSRVIRLPPTDPSGYEDVTLDYGRPAFALGADALIVEDPDAADNPNPDYKPPPAAKEGYTRSYSDDDVLVCVACGEELATGSDEIKQQVWISRKCGHVYCGLCATSARVIEKGGNGRDRKKAKQRKPAAFKHCKAIGCGKSLTGKTQLFQIYL